MNYFQKERVMQTPQAIRVFQWTAILVMLHTAFCNVIHQAHSGDTDFRVSRGERQLFLDDHGIAALDNLKRTMHQPKKKGAVIRPNWHLGVSGVQVRTAPVWDTDDNIFKFWDCAATPPDLSAAGQGCSGYYESHDGLHWSQPALGQINYERWPQNNYISLVHRGRHFRTDYVVYDPADPDPSRRYKCALPPTGFAVSPNGRQWRMLPDVPGIPSADEANFSFDAKANLFILTVKRSGPHGRSVCLATSHDFQLWTDHGLIFHADDHDQELGRETIRNRLASATLQPLVADDPTRYNVDVYNMGVFRYESVYIGMPAMYYATGPSEDGTNTDGFHLIQLACSRDLKNWVRLGDRQPFIGPSPPGGGAYDCTGMIGPSNAVVRGDELWFYYTSAKYRRPPAEADTDRIAISLAVLRRDGFISLDADTTTGQVTTKVFPLEGERLFVNVATRKTGQLIVEVLDTNGRVMATSTPVTGDHRRVQLNWIQGDISDLKGKLASLRFRLRAGSLYSYWLED